MTRITTDYARMIAAKWNGYDGPYSVTQDDDGGCVIHCEEDRRSLETFRRYLRREMSTEERFEYECGTGMTGETNSGDNR